MTGVAAQVCGRPDSEQRYKIETEFRKMGLPVQAWGTRKAICGDLSPVASFISYNYNTPMDHTAFEGEAAQLLKEVEDEYGWLYETKHSNGQLGRINYVVWSDVYICPSCNREIIFWEVAVDREEGSVRDEFHCNQCNALNTKRNISKAKTTLYDSIIGETITQTKTLPVLISYTCNRKRFEKTPDRSDLALIQKIEEMNIPYWFPKNKIPKGDKTGEPLREGFTHVHHFYTKRNLLALAKLYDCAKTGQLKLVINSIVQTLTSKLVRYNLGNRGNGPLSGTLYVSSLTAESNVFKMAEGKVTDFSKAFVAEHRNANYASSLTQTNLNDASIDYIFTDPPFGANIMYSELNFLWESWLRVRTNNKTEAIENKTQDKSTIDYQNIMTGCFKEYCRILKPGGWMTI